MSWIFFCVCVLPTILQCCFFSVREPSSFSWDFISAFSLFLFLLLKLHKRVVNRERDVWPLCWTIIRIQLDKVKIVPVLKFFKRHCSGTSLEVQCLRLHASTAECWFDPWSGNRFLHAAVSLSPQKDSVQTSISHINMWKS